ncbi:MAG TPA: 2-oxoacid:ferredoxin oxidoreductase subunit beta [Candidatus Paceibacterota bacterium]|nr:2-oxoacid:ferredoxin oxidoreductase subunit beta [Verrucomicrobiota bacterium]HRY48866.1 2-oxoacid:ferredoxin oxidoreductase subunit beta [Candidatus Paceibacterota bacterium]HSA03136.1 2-oxoacid:ferredoxin oxidoreductase subunit beta [Candidatus Paceibacterota bacterium]
MTNDNPETVMAYTAKDFRSELKPIWCPGCGDYGVVTAIYRALAAVGRPPHEIAFVSGIGCSSRIPGYTTAYGFNTVHGRALPIAQGIKMANPDLLVLVASGDGDGFSIGGGHVAHAIRRNIDLTYIVMDNQVYGLTKGQLSPTSPRGAKTASSTYGSLEEAVNPLLYVLAYGAGFVAQGVPADMEGLSKLVEAGIRYPGFAFINIQSPCVTYGDPESQLKNQKGKMRKLESEGHDPTNRLRAMELAQEYGQTLYTGIFYQDPASRPTYTDEVLRRQTELKPEALPRDQILSLFEPK